jgi:hypothetical protein
VEIGHHVLAVLAAAWSPLLVVSPNPVWVVAIGSEALCSVLQQWNSNSHGMVTVVRVNSSHPFPCGVVPTVARVRRHRDGSCWNNRRHVLLWYGRKYGLRRVRGTIVMCKKPGAEAGARARRRLRSRLELGRGIDCARGRGFGQVIDCARGRGSGESLIELQLGTCPCRSEFLFATFFPLG